MRKNTGKKIMLALVGILVFTGCQAIEKARYTWFGAGTQVWEKEAEEAGITNEIEEYYYEHLPEDEKETYRELYVRILKNEDSGPLYSQIGTDDFWKVYYAIQADHPEIFWLGENARVTEAVFTKRVTGYEFETTVPAADREERRQQLEAAADAWIGAISPEASDYEKIRQIYDDIIDATEYSTQGPDTQNIQSVLLYGSSVCAGYAKTFQYLLNRMGLFCTYLTGEITGGGSHGWNLVRLDEDYYYVDVTWGDPVFAGEEEGENNYEKNYSYLCCSEQELFETHLPDGTVELPQCTKDDYNYYKQNGLYYETFEYDLLYRKIMESVWNGEKRIVMKFGSEDVYQAACKELFEGSLLHDAGQYLMQLHGADSWKYRYCADEKTHLVTIYLVGEDSHLYRW